MANSAPPTRATTLSFARGFDDAIGNLLQQPVAETLSERIIDGFESIELDQQQGGLTAFTFCAGQHFASRSWKSVRFGRPVSKS